MLTGKDDCVQGAFWLRTGFIGDLGLIFCIENEHGVAQAQNGGEEREHITLVFAGQAQPIHRHLPLNII